MKKPKYTLEWFHDDAGAIRWRWRHRNGRIIEAATEGYKRQTTAKRVIYNVILAIRHGDFEETERR